MSLLTTWGYKLVTLDALPDLLTVDEFNAFTGNKYAGYAAQVAAEITAASATIRNYVGWHLAPSTSCELTTTGLDRRVTRARGNIMIQLPARHVTTITGVSIGGVDREDYILDPSGILWVLDVAASRRSPITVSYTAGLPDGLMALVKELVAHRVTHAVAVPAGVASEASGGVSVTYNANWINNARATALVGDNKEILIPYKVQGVF